MSTKKGNNVKKKLKLTGLLGAALLVLTACGTSQVTAQSTGGWERFVYFFAEAIRFLSFGGKYRCRDYRLYHCHPDGPFAALPISNEFNPQNAGNSTPPQGIAS